MGVVNDAIEDCVGDRWFTNHLMPLGDGQLRGDECRFSAIVSSDGAGEPGFARSRLSGKDQMFMGFEPGSSVSACRSCVDGRRRR
jgi:hypothetical protein